MRYARNVHFQIKNGKENEFKTLFESEVMPTLRKQKGFREELTLVNGSHGLGISLWEDRASAESYQSSTYPRLVEKLNPVIDGAPRVETYDVAISTLQT
jgi:quinol monooxygenase YgiN